MFSGKDQIVNTLGFMGYKLSVTTTLPLQQSAAVVDM